MPGKEEYLDSEKYELKAWDFDRPGNIKEHIRKLNRIRRANPALWDFRNTLFLNASNDQILSYARHDPREGQLRPRPRQPRSEEPPGMHLRGAAMGVRPSRPRFHRMRRPPGRRRVHAARQDASHRARSARAPGRDLAPHPSVPLDAHDRPQRHAMVSRRDLLSAARQVVLRFERRRHRRFRGRHQRSSTTSRTSASPRSG